MVLQTSKRMQRSAKSGFVWEWVYLDGKTGRICLTRKTRSKSTGQKPVVKSKKAPAPEGADQGS
ncbi:hypothetical protein BES34_009885 [Leptospira inadai serovar Lyme]|uniref:Uncharacterized protein n=1 Tax=Leptospira inadai serovar Lyme TaxID=293084 RepID=A0ABX4YJ58_9LEPT|nr:hypothetical protein BES34_009885 [Leptospira inadai serovar Lyme]